MSGSFSCWRHVNCCSFRAFSHQGCAATERRWMRRTFEQGQPPGDPGEAQSRATGSPVLLWPVPRRRPRRLGPRRPRKSGADHMLYSTGVVCTCHHESQAKRVIHRRDSFVILSLFLFLSFSLSLLLSFSPSLFLSFSPFFEAIRGGLGDPAAKRLLLEQAPLGGASKFIRRKCSHSALGKVLGFSGPLVRCFQLRKTNETLV